MLTDIEHKSIFYDAKTILQEYFQGEGGKLEYKLISSKGPEHNRVYTVVAYINGERYEEGAGQTKKMAEQVAAHKTIIKLNFDDSVGL